MDAALVLSRLGVPQSAFAREGVLASSPITGELIAYVRITSPEEVSAVTGRATQAFNAYGWTSRGRTRLRHTGVLGGERG
jgi:aldehyde dehydrogenase (NAD+)